MQNPNEQWQVDVKGEIYDTTFAELTVWIAEDSLLESDRVRRGNLRWLVAGKVPPLRPFFEARATGAEAPAVQMTATDMAGVEGIPATLTSQNIDSPAYTEEAARESPVEELFDNGVDLNVCNIHPDEPSEYICSACAHAFCKSCPEGFGATVKICPYCGAMCRLMDEQTNETEVEARIARDIEGGFGFGDFITALGYPFRFKLSLFFGGLIVAVLAYGRSAASIGSMMFIAAALICFIVSTAFVFGMISNTLNRFAKGEIDSNFMPAFDDFSAWDDVIHPFLLFLGAWIISFGPMFVLAIGLVWFAFSSAAVQNSETSALTKQSVQTVNHIELVRQKLKTQNIDRTDITIGEDGLTDAQRSTLAEEAEFQKVSDLANNYRSNQIESTVGPAPEVQREQMRAQLTKMAKGAGVFLIFIAIAFLWGAFFFPAACAVAGYTGSFAAAINPMVGIDTIRHMGFDYIKILLMTFFLWIVSAVIGGIVGALFSPFDMPGIGNVPATFVGSFIGFYFSVVFAVVLGLALYKNSEKLKLHR